MTSKNNRTRDDRFQKVKKDPRFWEIPENEQKIKIDKRFQSMFHDDKFKLKYTVDKRGRPINYSSSEDLKRFYNLSDTTEYLRKGEKTGAGVAPYQFGGRMMVTANKSTKGETFLTKDIDVQQLTRGFTFVQNDEKDHDEETEHEESSAKEPNEVKKQICLESGTEEGSCLDSAEDSEPDLARGMGNMETSSEEDDYEDDNVDIILRREEEEIEHDWGHLCKDAARKEEVSSRLAVCNMDWDRMKARDLLALFNSFKPNGGVVLSVKIYPSNFGKERIQMEQLHGPLELMALPEDPEVDTEEERIYREKMRDYQFKRLKYFYAVVECDSVETAVKIYEECDGFEFESSSAILDLRFIPNYTTFDEEPNDVATDVDLSAYTPKLFTSTAAATSKVQLTWDETDHERVTALSRTFNKDELLQMDFNAYLASSSDEEVGTFAKEPEKEDHFEAEPTEDELVKTSRRKKDVEQIAKYREMFKSIQDQENKQNHNPMEMEVTWVPGLKETTERLVQKKIEGKDKMTPWEEFLKKKKDKKRHKTKIKPVSVDSDFSDEIPPHVDINNPYVSEELGSAGLVLKNRKRSKKRKKVEETPKEEGIEKQRAEMALLMDDEDDGMRQHFNYDKIVKQQNLSKNTQKKILKKDGTPLVEDEFQVDVEDPRFHAMFTSHLYNLDPSDPGYKKTKATQSILAEKRRRREEQQNQQKDLLQPKCPSTHKNAEEDLELVQNKKECQNKPTHKTMDSSLAMLIKSVKNKTEQFQAQMKSKTTKD